MPRELHSTRAARGAQLAAPHISPISPPARGAQLAALLAGFAMMALLKIWV